jgi:hypothetical protein
MMFDHSRRCQFQLSLFLQPLVGLCLLISMSPIGCGPSEPIGKKETALIQGESVVLVGTENLLAYTRLWYIGNQSNITRIYFLIHGDGNVDYSNSTAQDRLDMTAHLPAGEGALLAYPINKAGDPSWPDFAAGINGKLVLDIYRQLETRIGGSSGIHFEQFSLSGGGRVNHALLRLINESYDSDSDVRDFVDSNLRGIHDGDSLCRSISDFRQNYIDAISRFKKLRFAFVHNTSGKMAYVHDHHNMIAEAFNAGQGYAYGDSLDVEGGRLRFWSAADHVSAWRGQFAKVFFGEKAAVGTRFTGRNCDDDNQCQGNLCLASQGSSLFAAGMCSRVCEKYCDDSTGEPTTFCISFDPWTGAYQGDLGLCFSQCDTAIYPGSGCREGYQCQLTARHNDSTTTANVCLPVTTPPASDATVDAQPADAGVADVQIPSADAAPGYWVPPASPGGCSVAKAFNPAITSVLGLFLCLAWWRGRPSQER